MQEFSDETIMMRIKEGHLSDLKELFERYHVKLYNFFLKLSFDKTASEDLTQNLFIRIIRFSHNFNEAEGSFKSWIYQMARNSYYDFYKQQRKLNGQFKEIDEEHFNVSDNENIFTEEHYNKLDFALSKLQSDQRELIVLSRFQGLKYEEISKIKDLSVSNVKVKIHRAIKNLKDIYFNHQLES